jgi:hypothetical protein
MVMLSKSWKGRLQLNQTLAYEKNIIFNFDVLLTLVCFCLWTRAKGN